MRHTARAIIIRNRKMLIVTGHGADFYWSPGGRIEKNEKAITALHCELFEELSVKMKSAKPYLKYMVKETGQEVENFIVEIIGVIKPNQEITKITWLSKANFVNKDINLSVGLTTKLTPPLIKNGLI